ncbi:MAG: phosphoribosylanthranilate isomerase [Spirochaetaceae bacterium]|jgi:phosphoribosylanthranilate isomerase|nr:phosphoribosylanthranilate isomerase [Spirochaetaceae bacterium]
MAKIKICGLFRQEDICSVNEAAPDYAGFVFAPQSRRFIDPLRAANLREGLDPAIIPVGVFVRAKIEEITALYRDGIIAMVQLHGGETGEYAAALRERCDAPIIRAFNAGDLQTPSGLSWYKPAGADYLLLDHGSGGTGQSFDWKLLDMPQNPAPQGDTNCPPQSPVPFFLAGGIGLHNIDRALDCRPYGVDISSGAETDGVKDREKMLRLVERVRSFHDGQREGP